ncbi:DNA-binding protein [Methylobacterium sp. NMS12]|uniref:DNA-binding protein n=1 Tax=Methylobacterium sp. NMS12 TaxID=3079766 RepID=UPI003F88177F
MDAETNYISTKKVLQRYDGISAMTLWRWERDPILPFPAPFVVNRRKFYDLHKIDAWERARAAAAAATVIAKAAKDAAAA